MTEFLPVSSSGHLALARSVLGYEAPEGALVEVLMHLGTALSIVVVFRADIMALLRAGLGLLCPWSWGAAWRNDEDFRLAVLILLSALPAAAVGLSFKDQIEGLFDMPVFVGFMLLVTAAILMLAGRGGETGGGSVGLRVALMMGLAQAVAILPGISRSGSTIAAGLLAGGSRDAVGRFAFLMALVPILGSAALEAGDAVGSTAPLGPLAFGCLIAFVSGLVALKVLLGFVARGRMALFAPYCVVVGLLAIFA